MRKNRAKSDLIKDIFLVFLGAILALLLSELGIIRAIIDLIGNQILASFFAGVFFTSVFTIAPASVAFSNIGDTSIYTVSFWGAIGALCGDLALFFFIRDRFVKDLKASIRPVVLRHIFNTFHLGFMKWLSPIVGAIIIASPLPDEFGLALLGFSRTKVSLLIPVSFVMNFIGIYLLLRLT